MRHRLAVGDEFLLCHPRESVFNRFAIRFQVEVYRPIFGNVNAQTAVAKFPF
jgi:hypothetical protein